jgi:YcxB-like protein
MEIFVRLLVWILNHTYPSGRSGTSQSALDEAVLRESREESEARRKDQLVRNFTSTAIREQGAVDYHDMNWESFSRVVETPEKFVFYGGRSVAKTIPKSAFSKRPEVATLRRMIRRRMADYEA